MKVAVTGASGKIGRELVRQLRSRGHETLSLDIRPPHDETVPYRVIDVRSASQLRRAFDGMDAVCHLGEWPNLMIGPAETYANNTEIGSFVMSVAQQVGVGRVIYTSSCQAYGYWGENDVRRMPTPTLPITEETPLRPMNAYGLSKASNEAFARLLSADTGLAIAAFRFPMVMTKQFIDWIAREGKMRQRPVPEGFGTYLAGDDASLAYCLALETGWQGFEAFHFVADDLTYSGDLKELLPRLWPDFLPAEGWNGHPVSTAKAREKFGWKPTWSVTQLLGENRVKMAQSA